MVLLIEDNAIDQMIARALLADLELAMATAARGPEVLEALKSESFNRNFVALA